MLKRRGMSGKVHERGTSVEGQGWVSGVSSRFRLHCGGKTMPRCTSSIRSKYSNRSTCLSPESPSSSCSFSCSYAYPPLVLIDNSALLYILEMYENRVDCHRT